MRYLWKKRENKRLSLAGSTLEPNIVTTIEVKEDKLYGDETEPQEYEVVERVIYPEKIICPDCGGYTLEGLDFCDKCGGEIHDMGEQ
ncbi:hypothetical protein [Anaerosporobacter faecicola]|uniref:hypothetical protein n=1 Tax=Anaerosporobacter faecicola TaxID=2718714 RepID=UPI00143C6CF7|nr:hypothetical protein [Anaerosporobacter faecicola]